MKKEIGRVWQTKAGCKFVTIPRNLPIEKGDYVVYSKVDADVISN